MDAWPYNEPAGFSPDLVQKHCVQNAEWQKVRLSMKGISTQEKLKVLLSWREKHTWGDGIIDFSCEVQIANYLGALRRGGQLDMQNRVQR